MMNEHGFGLPKEITVCSEKNIFLVINKQLQPYLELRYLMFESQISSFTFVDEVNKLKSRCCK